MLEIAFYKVTESIAQRSGLILERYRTKDMNWILDNKDLARIRFTPDEYIDGLTGVVKITEKQASDLIAENNYQMGYEGLEPNNQQEQSQEEQEVEQEAQTETVDEQTEQNDETHENAETETIEENEVGNVEDILGGGTQQEGENETQHN